jgi:hypothetical protein
MEELKKYIFLKNISTPLKNIIFTAYQSHVLSVKRYDFFVKKSS